MSENKRVSDEQFSDDGDETVHQPSGTRIRFGDDGTVGVPIVWDERDDDGWRLDEVVEKAVEIRKRLSQDGGPEPHEE
jgi:hypothetical protein